MRIRLPSPSLDSKSPPRQSPSQIVARIGVRRILTAFTWVFLTLWALGATFGGSKKVQSAPRWRASSYKTRASQRHEKLEPFYSYPVEGYDNGEISGRVKDSFQAACPALQTSAEIGYQKPWALEDDLAQIAFSLIDHPMVKYTDKLFPEDNEGLTRMSDLVKRSWDRMANACIYLPDQEVNLCVTRVLFKGNNNYGRCIISFLRGQIFSRDWVHLDDYHLRWEDKTIKFPTIFDIPSEFFKDGGTFGPEDPRVIIEQDIVGAEPVIFFNMKTAETDWKRAMWVLRPFSGHTTVLTVEGQERPKAEKNWVPLFLNPLPQMHRDSKKRAPSNELHLVYQIAPVKVLKCDLLTGDCWFVYKDTVPTGLVGKYDSELSFLRGGTQFVPIPLPMASHKDALRSPLKHTSHTNAPNYQAFLSFPRTHTEMPNVCRDAVYRPEMFILLTNGTSWLIAHASFPMDLGVGTLLDYKDFMDPCGRGRIMLFNSIASWEPAPPVPATGKRRNRLDPGTPQPKLPKGQVEVTDVMTITTTINDASAQAIRLTGIMDYIKGLPSIQKFMEDPAGVFDETLVNTEEVLNGKATRFERKAAAGMAVRSCVEVEAKKYVGEHLAPKHG